MIDGPPATTDITKYSRLGALSLLDHINSSGFIIIIDDAEREGEILLTEKIIAILNKRSVTYAIGQVLSNKRQVIVAGGTCQNAAYY